MNFTTSTQIVDYRAVPPAAKKELTDYIYIPMELGPGACILDTLL